MPSRSPTSYAVLGLLTVRDWTTYELAKQVRRSLNWFWPRAERKLYDEPRALAEAGLVTATQEFTGRRPRTLYAITDEGREALRQWLSEPAAPRSGEFEAMLKVFFADAGSLEQLDGTIAAVEAEARERLAELRTMAGEPSAFPRRAHINALAIRLQFAQERAVLDWARWAREQIAQWPSTTDPGRWDTRAALDEVR